MVVKMPHRRSKLVDYFDKPAPMGSGFSWCDTTDILDTSKPFLGMKGGKFMKHGDQRVFVPDGHKPDQLPAGKHFFVYKSREPITDDTWGHSTEKLMRIRDRQEHAGEYAEWKVKNKEIIRAADGKPAPNTTHHIPGNRWRTSDMGYDPTLEEKRKQKIKGKVHKIEELKKKIKRTQKEALGIIREHRSAFRGHYDGMAIKSLFEVESQVHELKAELNKQVQESGYSILPGDDSTVKKSKRASKSSFIHSHVSFIESAKHLEDLMFNLGHFAHSVKDKVFIGKVLPGRAPGEHGTGYPVYTTVLRAAMATIKHQILQSLTKEHANSKGEPGKFAALSKEATRAVKELQKLTHKKHKKHGEKEGSHPHHPDHAQLVKWHETHRPW